MCCSPGGSDVTPRPEPADYWPAAATTTPVIQRHSLCGREIPQRTLRRCRAPPHRAVFLSLEFLPPARVAEYLQALDRHISASSGSCRVDRTLRIADRGTERGMSSFHIHPTEPCQSLFIVVTLSDIPRSNMVPPAGFEPALPPPETGRSRDRGRLLASYLGFLFASCVSGGLLCAVVRSTRHSTTSVLSGRVRGLRARRSRRSP